MNFRNEVRKSKIGRYIINRKEVKVVCDTDGQLIT